MERWTNGSSQDVEIVLHPWQQSGGSLSPSAENHSLIGAVSLGTAGIVSFDETNNLKHLVEHKDATAKISRCDGILGSPLRICDSVLGIASPIVTLNKAVPGDTDSVQWQASMDAIRADRLITERLGVIRVGADTQQEDFPLSTSDKASEVREGLNQAKPGTNVHEQISLDHRTRDLFVKLEGQLRKHALDLIDVLGEAVCRRVHNLPRTLSAPSIRDRDGNRTKHRADFVNPIELNLQGCDNPTNPDVVEFELDLKATTRDEEYSASWCLSQGGIPIPPATKPTGTGSNIPSHRHPSCRANHTNSTRQEQLQQDLSKPQTDRCTGESSQTGSDLGCHGDGKYCSLCRVAILFSGGIDSMVLAVLADR